MPVDLRVRNMRFPARRLTSRVLSLTLAVSIALTPFQPVALAAELPMPSANWLGSGQASHVYTGNTLTINQATQRAILNWQNFNISRDGTVRFNQPGSTAATLNRIFDANPSLIEGQLTANGQIYLINQSGIIFGRGAQVNVGSLVASTLNISDDLFQRGLLSAAAGTPAFSFAGTAEQYASNLIRIDDGASLQSERGGRIMVLAPKVENNGTISTPEGQTIIAAGARVYLAAPLDTSLRGFLVEVDPFIGSDAGGNAVSLGGQALNTALGRIVAARGNVTIAALAVNQSGRVTATTSVNLNGSIRLLARDTSQTFNDTSNNVTIPLAIRGGSLVLGEGSVTEVVPETSDARTILDEQAFGASSIELRGRTIHAQGDSLILAPGGNVSVVAQAGQLFQLKGEPIVDGVRVYFEPGSIVDVSGTRDVVVPIERNVIEVELRGTELANSPLQRNSFLRGQKIRVDVRKGTPIADISGVAAQVGRSVAEKTSSGGEISVRSEGDIVLRQGTTLNVSGGSLHYRGGYLNTTKLYAQGRLYDISEADPNRIYEGTADTFVKRYAKWGVTETFQALSRGEYSPGYREGRNAGTIELIAHQYVIDGDLLGRVTPGLYQREAGKIPAGGQVVIGDRSQSGAVSPDFKAPDVLLQAGRSPLPSSFGFDSGALPAGFAEQATLSLDALRQGQISRLAVYSNGRITLADELALPAGGALNLSGRQLDIRRNIAVPAGAVTLSTRDIFDTNSNPVDHVLSIAAGVVVSGRGLWVNDSPLLALAAGTDPALINGGSISVSSVSDLILGQGSVIDVSSGAWLKADGELKSGNAGSISLATGRIGLLEGEAQQSILRLGGDLRAYAAVEGGKLSIDASSVRIGGGAGGPSAELHLDPGFFQQGGFREYAVSGQDGVTVTQGTQLAITPRNLVPDSSLTARRSGADIFGFSRIETLPLQERAAAVLTLSAGSANFGNLMVEQGATLSTGPRGSITLQAGRQLTVLGDVITRGGAITLSNSRPSDSESFEPGLSIWIGSDARLLASGTYVAKLNDDGLRRGDVIDGGSITINAGKGYIVAAAGALLDVSGTSAVLDLPRGDAGTLRVVPVTVAGNAGSVRFSAREGILFDGRLRAQPGSGANAAGGSLNVVMNVTDANPFFPGGDRVVILSEGSNVVPAGLQPGDAIDFAQFNGKGHVSAAAVRSGGFDSLSLSARDRIELDSIVDLALRRSIRLDAPVIAGTGGADIRLDAAYVGLGNSDASRQTQQASSGGTGVLALSGNLVELIGRTALRDFGETRIISDGDLRLRGVLNGVPSQSRPQDGRELVGALVTGGSIRVRAAQVYPTTLSQFTLAVKDNPSGSIVFERTGNSGPVLSAAGILTVEAPVVEQGGVLKAPLGQIVLDASERLTLSTGSETSVSAQGQLIPFGRTELSGRDYTYVLDSASTLIFETPPEKRISLSAPDVGVASGATINLSGGGDLYAYEFTAGPGGSRDALDPANTPATYAILPSLGTGSASYDHQYYSGVEDLAVGDAVFLSGASGLPTGYYTLLPARYALLPGAYLVTAKSGYQDILPGQTQPRMDGSQVVSGYRAYVARDGSIVRDSRYSGFDVRPGTVARTQSEYRDTFAGDFFSGTTAPLPGDAGRLAVSAATVLALDGNFLTGHVSGRRGAEVDINALRLAVLGDGATDPGAGFVRLDTGDIARLNAGSLLLGGIRASSADGVAVQVGAQEVLIANDASSALRGPELLIAARDSVTVRAGSVIEGSGTFSGDPRNIHIGDIAVPGSGDGVLLRVSSGQQSDLFREGVNRARGTLTVEAGALVRAGKSIVLDATFDNRFLGTLALGEDGALALGASRISVGDVPDGTEGLMFSNNDISALATLKDLRLRSYSTVDLYGAATLGSPALQNLAIETAGIGGYVNAGMTASLSAQTVSLSNPNGLAFSVAPGATPGTGNLQIATQSLLLGPAAAASEFAVNGYSLVEATAAREIVVAGTGHFSTPGDLTLTASRITAETGARYAISADGELRTSLPAAPTVDLPEVQGLAATLDLAGRRVVHRGNIVLAAGTVNLTATGDGAVDGVLLGTGSSIFVAGTRKLFGDSVATASAGTVQLVAAAGDVIAEAGSSIDLAGLGGSDAGSLSVIAENGTAFLDGVMNGSAAAMAGVDPRQGSIVLDVGSLADFSALNARLNQGGFSESRNIRLRNGDIAVADLVTAHNVQLATDDGDIRIGGVIDASGAKGGSIALAANRRSADTVGAGNVILLAGARLDVSSTADPASVVDENGRPFGTRGQGGTVLLSSSGTQVAGDVGVDVGSGSTINVASAGMAANGSMILRAPRSNVGTEVLIAPVSGAILANNSVAAPVLAAEAVKVYDGVGNIGTVDGSGRLTFSAVEVDNNAFMNNASVINARLGNGVRTRTGIEIRSVGDISLDTDWNLYSASRHGGEPGVLTIRAGGNLNLNGSLSDGFDNATSAAALQAGESWSYRLVGGADLAAADPLAVRHSAAAQSSTSGDVVVGAGKLVRTGTGSIKIAAGRNLVLTDQGSVIYTAGVPGAVLQNFPASISIGGVTAEFPFGGGDLNLSAQGNVVAAPTTQLINNWLYRQGRLNNGNVVSNLQTAWWTRFGDFRQGIAALGGGDVTVLAGGDISNLPVSLPTNGRLSSVAEGVPDAGGLTVQGGGDLEIVAGGNINSGIFYVDRGHARIVAGGALGSSRSVNGSPLNTILALGDAQLVVRAAGDVAIETVLNPTVVSQWRGTDGRSGNLGGSLGRQSFFFTYSEDASVSVGSSGGDVVFSNSANLLERAFSPLFTSQNSLERRGLFIYPGTLTASALSGNVAVNGGFSMYPSSTGNLELLAADSVSSAGRISMSDVLPGLLPSSVSPDQTFSARISGLIVNASAGGFLSHSNPVLHALDLEPVRIIALDGDVTGPNSLESGPSVLGTFPKPVTVQAGGDIRNVWIVAQNLRDTDVSSLSAGRDVVFDTQRDASGNQRANSGRIEIGGPGRLEVIAGRNVDLGNSSGIITRGNLNNPYLPESGAGVLVRAGARNADYASFIRDYITQPAAGQRYADELAAYMRAFTDDQALSVEEALVRYFALPDLQQTEFANLVFYSELRAVGRVASRTAGGIARYAGGFDAIAKLFPVQRDGRPIAYKGDVNLFFSQIKTEQGGDIDIMAPGGLVNAGLANPGGLGKSASQLGIVTARGGSIRSFVKSDFLVNQSRVFTLQGGDILIWSSEGNIDAGKGAKTARATPPPQLIIRDDQFILDTTNSVAGSGIAVLLANEGVVPGDVDLIAPRGEVNAGDAGIRAAGNINIAAVRVVGADNISVGGISTGVPAASTGSIAAGLTGVSNLASDATKSAEQSTRALADTAAKSSALQQAFRPSFITIEVLGYGDS